MVYGANHGAEQLGENQSPAAMERQGSIRFYKETRMFKGAHSENIQQGPSFRASFWEHLGSVHYYHYCDPRKGGQWRKTPR